MKKKEKESGSKLLIDVEGEDILHVCPNIAIDIGLHKTIILRRMYDLSNDPNSVVDNWLLVITGFGWKKEFPFWANSTIKSLFKRLKDDGLIISRKMTQLEIVERLKRKSPQKLNTDFKWYHKCVWCMGETYAIHRHHYPLREKDGGNQIVKICTNCHYEYHALRKATVYSLSKDCLNWFNVNCKKCGGCIQYD